MAAFKAHLETTESIDLTQLPFNAYRDKISSKGSYQYSQTLGTKMWKAGIDVFIFTSLMAILLVPVFMLMRNLLDSQKLHGFIRGL